MKELYLGKPYEKNLDVYFYTECLFRLIEMPNDLYDELCVGDYIDPACLKDKKLKLSNINRWFDFDAIKEIQVCDIKPYKEKENLPKIFARVLLEIPILKSFGVNCISNHNWDSGERPIDSVVELDEKRYFQMKMFADNNQAPGLYSAVASGIFEKIFSRYVPFDNCKITMPIIFLYQFLEEGVQEFIETTADVDLLGDKTFGGFFDNWLYWSKGDLMANVEVDALEVQVHDICRDEYGLKWRGVFSGNLCIHDEGLGLTSIPSIKVEKRKIADGKKAAKKKAKLTDSHCSVKVRFADGQALIYNCEKEVSVGNQVMVSGMRAGMKGIVEEIAGKWSKAEDAARVLIIFK